MKLRTIVDQNLGLISSVAISFALVFTAHSYKYDESEVKSAEETGAVELFDAEWSPVCGYLPDGQGIDLLTMVGVDWTVKQDAFLTIVSDKNDREMRESDIKRLKNYDHTAAWAVKLVAGETVYVPFSANDQAGVKTFRFDINGKVEIRTLTQNQLVDSCGGLVATSE